MATAAPRSSGALVLEWNWRRQRGVPGLEQGTGKSTPPGRTAPSSAAPPASAGTGRGRAGQSRAGRGSKSGSRRGPRPAQRATIAPGRPRTWAGRAGPGPGSPRFRNRPRGGLSGPDPPRDLRRGAAPDPPPRPPLPSPGRRKDK